MRYALYFQSLTLEQSEVQAIFFSVRATEVHPDAADSKAAHR